MSTEQASQTDQAQDWPTLALIQFVLLCTLAFACATTFRSVLWVVTQQLDLYADYQGIVLFLPDYVLIGLVVVTALRLVIEADYRRIFAGSVAAVLRRGGVWWLALIVWMALS